MKELKIKREFVYSIYKTLKEVPPADVPTTEEIITTATNILPALKEGCVKYADFTDGIDELRKKVIKKKMSEKEANKKRDEMIEVLNKYADEHDDDIISLKFEDAVFKVLKEQFDRKEWGTKFVTSIEKFVVLSKAFEEAENSHVKNDKE